ncbi:hypothetical protein [Pseudomonas viridiflava]|uniref:hypothetical protein n=1 Tax=Pseudomonas viridiflava TaxID=33069 RepID=UPI0013CEE669|nr:hypothetical protein [Pseudomonas viridiflava]
MRRLPYPVVANWFGMGYLFRGANEPQMEREMPELSWTLIFPIGIGLGLAWLVDVCFPTPMPREIGLLAAGVGGVLGAMLQWLVIGHF